MQERESMIETERPHPKLSPQARAREQARVVRLLLAMAANNDDDWFNYINIDTPTDDDMLEALTEALDISASRHAALQTFAEHTRAQIAYHRELNS
jgi:hypothetical protein